MSGGRDTSEAGFTLAEMLVSLALMAMAAAMMVEGLGSGQTLWARETARSARGQGVEAAETLLRADIEQLSPLTRSDSTTVFVAIEGGPHRLVFVGPPPRIDRPAAARRYRLTLNDQGELVLGAGAVEIDPDAPSVYTDQVLLRDVGGLDISYFGPDPKGGLPRWQTDWSRRVVPPQLVKIKLTPRTGDGPAKDPRDWPELIVHPAATVDSLCMVDAATGLCRGRS